MELMSLTLRTVLPIGLFGCNQMSTGIIDRRKHSPSILNDEFLEHHFRHPTSAANDLR